MKLSPALATRLAEWDAGTGTPTHALVVAAKAKRDVSPDAVAKAVAELRAVKAKPKDRAHLAATVKALEGTEARKANPAEGEYVVVQRGKMYVVEDAKTRFVLYKHKSPTAARTFLDAINEGIRQDVAEERVREYLKTQRGWRPARALDAFGAGGGEGNGGTGQCRGTATEESAPVTQTHRVPPFLASFDAAMRWIARHRQDPGYAAWAEERAGATRQDPNEPKWIEARAAEYVAFAHEAYHVGRITLYRALRLSKNRDGAYPIDLNCLGKSWSRFRRTADVYGASWRRGDDLLITGHVSPSDVDWPYSFRSFLHYGPDQWEVSLLAHSPVEIESIERDGDLVQGPTLGSSGPAGEEWNEECGPKTSSSYKSNPASTSAPPPPFAFVADLGPVLLAQGRRGLVGEAYDGTVFDLSERDILHAVNILPGAAVFPFLHAEGLLTRRERSEPRFSRTGPRLVAANPLGLVGGRGARFEPLPEGVASGFPRARQEIERYRAEVPTTRVIILSMAFAISTVRTNIASAERAFACYGERYHTTQGPPSYDDILDCFTLYGRGLAPSKTETLRGIAPYGETIESAMLLGLRDRDLRRHLATATDLPPGLSLAKLSFTLALLGQNVICLDARLLGTMFDAEEQETFNRRTKKADKGPSRGRLRQDAVDAYEEAEDLFLDGNRYYDPSDPLGQARAQWMSWESVGEKSKTGTLHRRGMRWQVVPAEHAVWIDVVSQGELRSPYDARFAR
jgi:hypothetical protein